MDDVGSCVVRAGVVVWPQVRAMYPTTVQEEMRKRKKGKLELDRN